ncbi:MAG: ABC transporter substrate-binding protein [Armatimonadota bacterium]
MLASLPGCAVRSAGGEAERRLTLWHPWGGPMRERFDALTEQYMAAHPDLELRAVFTSNDLSTNQKFFTAVAAKRPPDMVFVDGPQVAEWAARGALAPLDEYIEAAGIEEADFFPPCWRQNCYQGHVYALTFCADPNFAFVWNKEVFREVGLDPERPPRTIAEMDEYSDRITRVEGGKITRIGIIPWGIYGSANSIYTWGWAFGGRFYDYDAQAVTAGDRNVLRALEWMRSYADRYDVTRITSLQQGFGSAEHNPFYIGELAMTCLHIAGLEDIYRYAPDLDFGVTYLPTPEGGEEHSSWVGGWCLAIPTGSRQPQAAWDFIRWACADAEGTTAVGRQTGLFPGYRPSPYFDEVREKEHYDMFLKILEECRHQRPVMPAQAFYMGALTRAVDGCVYGQKTAQEALQHAQTQTQYELEIALRG